MPDQLSLLQVLRDEGRSLSDSDLPGVEEVRQVVGALVRRLQLAATGESDLVSPAEPVQPAVAAPPVSPGPPAVPTGEELERMRQDLASAEQRVADAETALQPPPEQPPVEQPPVEQPPVEPAPGEVVAAPPAPGEVSS